MGPKSPGGNLAWITPLLLIAGAYMCVDYVRSGSFGFAAVYGLLAVLALLVWFDLRWVSWPLIVYFSIAAAAGVFVLATKGFSWRLAARLAFIGYVIHDVWEWGRKRSDE